VQSQRRLEEVHYLKEKHQVRQLLAVLLPLLQKFYGMEEQAKHLNLLLVQLYLKSRQEKNNCLIG